MQELPSREMLFKLFCADNMHKDEEICADWEFLLSLHQCRSSAPPSSYSDGDGRPRVE